MITLAQVKRFKSVRTAQLLWQKPPLIWLVQQNIRLSLRELTATLLLLTKILSSWHLAVLLIKSQKIQHLIWLRVQTGMFIPRHILPHTSINRAIPNTNLLLQLHQRSSRLKVWAIMPLLLMITLKLPITKLRFTAKLCPIIHKSAIKFLLTVRQQITAWHLTAVR